MPHLLELATVPCSILIVAWVADLRHEIDARSARPSPYVLVDCRARQRRNLVNTIAPLPVYHVEIAGGKLGLRILSNLW